MGPLENVPERVAKLLGWNGEGGIKRAMMELQKASVESLMKAQIALVGKEVQHQRSVGKCEFHFVLVSFSILFRFNSIRISFRSLRYNDNSFQRVLTETFDPFNDRSGRSTFSPHSDQPLNRIVPLNVLSTSIPF